MNNVEQRFFDLSLEEALGGKQAPDLRHSILRRAQSSSNTKTRSFFISRKASAAAATVLVSVSIGIGAYLSSDRQSPVNQNTTRADNNVSSNGTTNKEHQMELGEFYFSLNVSDVKKSLDFYQKLGFVLYDDYLDQNWCRLRHNNLLLDLYQGHIERNLINFRGADVNQIKTEASKQGLVFDESRGFTTQADGSGSAELIDPEGNVIFFNTDSEERQQWLENANLYQQNVSEEKVDGSVDLGEFHYTMRVTDIKATVDFYESLGFEMVKGDSSQLWCGMKYNNLLLDIIHESIIERNFLCFRSGDVREIASFLKAAGLELSKEFSQQEGSKSTFAEIIDPDGNVIYFSSYPDEHKAWAARHENAQQE